MPRRDITRSRPPNYSLWHRVYNIMRYMPGETEEERERQAASCYQADCDRLHFCEYEYGTGRLRNVVLPAAIIEEAVDTEYNREKKPRNGQTLAWESVARHACIPFVICLWKPSDTMVLPDNPDVADIERFAVQVALSEDASDQPLRAALRAHEKDGMWRILTPVHYARFVLLMHENAKRVYHGMKQRSRLSRRKESRTRRSERSLLEQPELMMTGEDRSA